MMLPTLCCAMNGFGVGECCYAEKEKLTKVGVSFEGAFPAIPKAFHVQSIGRLYGIARHRLIIEVSRHRRNGEGR